jgi:hypothetical protein
MEEKKLQAIYEAPLIIGGKKLACAVLNDGTRVISRNAIFRAFGRTKRGRALNETREPNMPSFIDAKNLKQFINNELDGVLKGVEYLSKNGKILIKGFRAEVLPMMCKVYLEARRRGDILTKSQEPVAIAAEILMEGLSTIGIIALIDEATGYQEIRDRHALEKILEAYITKELMKWQKRFPDEWYENLFRLRGWEWKGRSFNPPQYVGKITNEIIYERLPKGVLDELKIINPPNEKGNRAHKHHQWLSPELGHPKLTEIVTGTNTLMRISPNWRKFKEHLVRAFPKYGDQYYLELDQ